MTTPVEFDHPHASPVTKDVSKLVTSLTNCTTPHRTLLSCFLPPLNHPQLVLLLQPLQLAALHLEISGPNLSGQEIEVLTWGHCSSCPTIHGRAIYMSSLVSKRGGDPLGWQQCACKLLQPETAPGKGGLACSPPVVGATSIHPRCTAYKYTDCSPRMHP